MENLGLWTIFIPTRLGCNTAFFQGIRDNKNNLTVRDGAHRQVYTIKLIIATKFFRLTVCEKAAKGGLFLNKIGEFSKDRISSGLKNGGIKLMKARIFILISFIFIISSCSLLTKSPHPELSRSFDWRTAEPGEYPFCMNYDEEFFVKIQMEGP